MVSPFRLVAVGGDARQHALLTWLQLESLPHDTPANSRLGYWWLVFEGNNPAAFAGLQWSSSDPSAGYLCRSGVLKQYRGAGLQRRLIAARIRKAKSLGMKTLTSDTFCNPQSSNNLIASGFRMFSPAKPWGLTNASYWTKAIALPTQHDNRPLSPGDEG